MPRPTRLLLAALAAAVALPALAASEDAPDGPRRGPTTAEGRSEPQYPQSFVEAYEVETGHGVLRGEVRRPVVPEGVRVPIILQVSPYGVLNESLSRYQHAQASAVANWFVPRGYAFATFDAVGTHASGGCTQFGGPAERESTAELVDHLGALDWSNGRVGMIGGSYDGTLAIAAAVEAPEHLVTIVPQVAIDRWYDYMHNQGVKLALEDVSGPSGSIPLDPPIDSPADYDFAYGIVPDPTKDPQAIAAATADHVRPCNRVENQTRGYELDPLYDQFWQQRDYRADAEKVRASVLFEGAWLDDNVKHWAATRFFTALPDELPKRLVIGQWRHSASRFGDALAIRHAWFDHFLLGLDTGILDIARVDSQGSDGMRRQSDQWPPAGTTEQAVAFTLPDGATWMDLDPTLVEERLVRRDCAPTCIRLVTEPFVEDVRIVGAPRLEVTATTDAASTHLTPVVLDVAPDGTTTIVSRGLANSRNRNGLDVGEDLVPGEPWSMVVELWDLDHVLPAGHHLEVVLSSTNATFGVPDETRATTTLDAEASRLVLPVHPHPTYGVVEDLTPA